MHITVCRRVYAPAPTVYRYLTEPDRMNLWSLARIRGIESGANGSYGDVGTIRYVDVPRVGTLREVIREARPAEKFVYCVFDTPGVSNHQGTITFRQGSNVRGTFTDVRWDVDAHLEFRQLENFFAASLKRDLDTSLQKLSYLLNGIESQTSSRIHSPRSDRTSPKRGSALKVREQDWRDAQETLQTQQQTAESMMRANDPKAWFARVYQYVTTLQIQRCEAGEVDHPAWVLRLIPVFDYYYFQMALQPLLENPAILERIKANKPTDGIPAHWHKAFAAMHGFGGKLTDSQALFLGLKNAIIAHIEVDLPMAMRDVHVREFNSLPFVLFRADYLRMAPLFEQASQMAIAEMPEKLIPPVFRLLQATIPQALQQRYSNKNFYNVGKARFKAFTDAEALIREARQ